MTSKPPPITNLFCMFPSHLSLLRTCCASSPLSCPSVSQRNEGEEGMCLTEFLYPALQAYDFLQLHKQHNCWMQVPWQKGVQIPNEEMWSLYPLLLPRQVGGSDQWGNISIGYEYVRKLTGSEVQGECCIHAMIR